MTKITVEIELDEIAYKAKYGPDSEWWNKHMVDWVREGKNQHPIRIKGVPKPASEYKPLEGQALEDTIVEILSEGFYDWKSQGWMKFKLNGMPCCASCGRIEGRRHQDWCGLEVASPGGSAEAS
jgi:hypothetical protein